jgi:hypothetical protein
MIFYEFGSNVIEMGRIRKFLIGSAESLTGFGICYASVYIARKTGFYPAYAGIIFGVIVYVGGVKRMLGYERPSLSQDL